MGTVVAARHAVLEAVVVALVGDINVADELQPRLAIDGAGHDRDRRGAIALPEQIAAAGLAEATLRLGRGAVPGKALLHRQAEIGEICRRRMNEAAAGTPAHAAMA